MCAGARVTLDQYRIKLNQRERERGREKEKNKIKIHVQTIILYRGKSEQQM